MCRFAFDITAWGVQTLGDRIGKKRLKGENDTPEPALEHGIILAIQTFLAISDP
jgi:hypothetical protein